MVEIRDVAIVRSCVVVFAKQGGFRFAEVNYFLFLQNLDNNNNLNLATTGY